MDSGAAALIAGMAGMSGALGGALIGGIAAVRGARVGAETTAAAALQQIQDQAATEHQHWLREQRQQTYSALITELQTTRQAVHSLVAALYADRRPESQLHAAQASIRNLVDSGVAVALLGPEAVIESQQRVTDRVLRLEERLLESFRGGPPVSPQDWIDPSLDEFERAAEGFVIAARQVLASVQQ